MESGVDCGPTSRCPDSPRPHLEPRTVEHLDPQQEVAPAVRREPFEVKSDPVAQWLDWEQQANLVGFRTSTAPVQVDVVAVPRSEVEVHVLPGAPAEVVDLFLRGDRVLVPRHPLNRDPTVAFSNEPVAERWTARFTSSRTLAFPGRDSGDALFSLKLATDHPHPDFRQPEKTKLRAEAFDAVGWAWVLARIDQLLGPIEGVALVPEVMIVLAAGREGGFLCATCGCSRTATTTCPRSRCRSWAAAIARRHGADARGVLGPALRRAGRAREGAPARALRALVRDAEPAEPARAARPEPLPDRQARVPRRRRRRLRHRRARGARRAVAAARSRICAPRRAPRSGRSTRRASTRSPADVLERWYARHDAAYYAELARWFPEIAPPPERQRASARSGTGTRRCAATRARKRVARAFAEPHDSASRHACSAGEVGRRSAGRSSAATPNSQSSRPGAATSCTPTGRPSRELRERQRERGLAGGVPGLGERHVRHHLLEQLERLVAVRVEIRRAARRARRPSA